MGWLGEVFAEVCETFFVVCDFVFMSLVLQVDFWFVAGFGGVCRWVFVWTEWCMICVECRRDGEGGCVVDWGRGPKTPHRGEGNARARDWALARGVVPGREAALFGGFPVGVDGGWFCVVCCARLCFCGAGLEGGGIYIT